MYREHRRSRLRRPHRRQDLRRHREACHSSCSSSSSPSRLCRHRRGHDDHRGRRRRPIRDRSLLLHNHGHHHRRHASCNRTGHVRRSCRAVRENRSPAAHPRPVANNPAPPTAIGPSPPRNSTIAGSASCTAGPSQRGCAVCPAEGHRRGPELEGAGCRSRVPGGTAAGVEGPGSLRRLHLRIAVPDNHGSLYI